MRVPLYLMTAFIFITFICLFFPRSSHAYIDPGTGSFILQVTIATLLSSLLAVKVFWGKIKDFFLKKSTKGKSEDNADNNTPG